VEGAWNGHSIPEARKLVNRHLTGNLPFSTRPTNAVFPGRSSSALFLDLTTRWHSQRSLDRGLFSCLMPFASHDLFMSAFSAASGFLSITVALCGTNET
jgi:hypothetical protein